MAKINDTTTFPNTTPALGDHVPGTDVSNTTNDANGETVTFLWSAVQSMFQSNMGVPTSVSSAYRTSTILSSTSNAEGAALIGVEDAGTYFAGATVEAVLAEIGALLPAEANADVTDETNVLAALSGATLTEVDPAATDKVLVLDASDSFNIKNITWSDVTGLASTPEGTAILSTGPVTDGYVLTADGAGGAAWEAAAAGAGTVDTSGSPASTYIATFSDADTITGTSGLTYGSSILEFSGGLLLNERADHAATPAAGKAELWLSNDVTQRLYMTDDAGSDKEFAFVTSGTNLASFTGIFGLDGGSAVDVTTKSMLEARLTDVSDLAEADGDVYTGTHDFGGADDLEIPNGTSITLDTAGQIGIDTSVTDFSAGVLEYYAGEVMACVALPIAELTTPTGGHVVAYNATTDEFELVAQAGGGDMSAATYDPATIAEQLVGLTAAQTLSNKTLTSPIINTPSIGTSFTFDSVTVTGLTGADVNVVTGTAGTSGDLVLWNVDGDIVDGPTPPSGAIVGTTDAQTLTNKTLTSPSIGTGFTFDGVTFTGATGADVNIVSGTAGTSGNVAVWNVDGDVVDSTVVAADILVDGDIGTLVQGYDADTLKADTADQLTAGFTAATDDDSTAASPYTPDHDTGNYKRVINDGAMTINGPTMASGESTSMVILLTNTTGAGSITFGTTTDSGDTIGTTTTDEYLIFITAVDVGGTTYSHASVKALQ